MKKILKYVILSLLLLLFTVLLILSILYINIDKYCSQYDANIEITDEYLIEAQRKIKEQGINPETRLLLADGYKMAGQYDIAIKMFNELLQEDKRAYLGLAQIYIIEKDYKNGIKYIDLFLKNPHLLDNVQPQEQRIVRQLLFDMKARAHWKLHQYIEWYKIFPIWYYFK